MALSSSHMDLDELRRLEIVESAGHAHGRVSQANGRSLGGEHILARVKQQMDHQHLRRGAEGLWLLVQSPEVLPEINEDTDIRVGDILTIEGGFGKSFMDGAASAGLAYYAQWKVSRDDFGVTPLGGPFLGQHEVYGVGAELMLPLASKSKLYGFANLRYFWETGAKTTLEGEALLLTLSFPFPSIPLQ